MTLTFGSLFSGIGGFDLGFKRAGMECLWQVEIDSKCQDILRRNLLGAEIYSDVREVGKHNLKPVDVICGGFPCQDLSIAGRREGLAGERSGLWFEFHRIIAELRPGWVVIENVPGLLSSNGGEDFAVILRGLVELGYGVSWRVLDAQYFGVPQRRRRVFIVGSLGNGSSAQVLFEREGGARNTPPRREAGQGVAGTLDGKSTSSNRGSRANEHEFIVAHALSASKTATGRLDPNGQDFVVAHETGKGFWTEGLPGLRADPGGMPENVIAYTIQQNDNGNHRRKDRPNGGLYVKETDTALTVGSADMTAIAYNIMPQNSAKDYKAKETDYSQALTTGGNHSGDQGGTYIAFSAGQSSKAYGIAADENVTPPIMAGESGTNRVPTIAWHENKQGNLTPSDHAKAFRSGASHSYQGVGVRRLTPIECERLQGFPDNWTDEQADSTRYRQLGNAVAVPVIEWIGERIAEVKE